MNLRDIIYRLLQPYRSKLWPFYVLYMKINTFFFKIKLGIITFLNSQKRPSKYKNCWLISDRIDHADDNGEHLYRYIQKNYPNQSIFFLLSPSSSDWNRLAKESFDLVPVGSEDHRLALDDCQVIISSHADNCIVNYFGEHSDWRKKFVFLQHGVTKDDLSSWLNFKNISLFITTTEAEHESIAATYSRYRFHPKTVKLVGMPRHDMLLKLNNPQKLIIIAPTWRKSLTVKKLKREEFLSTDYSRAWSGLLESTELKNLVMQYGYKVIFIPHPNFKQYLEYVSCPDFIEIYETSSDSIQKVLAQAALLITDYSSLAFEMAVLCKPVLYYQYDHQEIFLLGNHTYERGYYS